MTFNCCDALGLCFALFHSIPLTSQMEWGKNQWHSFVHMIGHLNLNSSTWNGAKCDNLGEMIEWVLIDFIAFPSNGIIQIAQNCPRANREEEIFVSDTNLFEKLGQIGRGKLPYGMGKRKDISIGDLGIFCWWWWEDGCCVGYNKIQLCCFFSFPLFPFLPSFTVAHIAFALQLLIFSV
jgi:hypothetical protein